MGWVGGGSGGSFDHLITLPQLKPTGSDKDQGTALGPSATILLLSDTSCPHFL
jgi:hypothetical protein